MLIVKTYIDEAKSATTDDRPQFLQMMNDAQLGSFDVVMVHKLDGFARTRYDSAFYKWELKKNQIKSISVLKPLDDSPESITLESVLEGMDRNKRMASSYRSKTEYLLSGLIYCSHCDSAMGGNSRKAGRTKEYYYTYECLARKRKKTCTAKGINKEWVESLVMDELELRKNSLLIDEEMIVKHLKKNANIKSKSPDDQKKIIQTYVTKVCVSTDNIDIELIVDTLSGGGPYTIVSTIPLDQYRR